MCDMTHSYVWHDSFICVTWLNHVCHMTHSYVWRGSFACVTWLNHICDMTHSYVHHDPLICATWLIHMCHMTHAHVWLMSRHSRRNGMPPTQWHTCGVATTSRLLEITGPFCKTALQKRLYSAKETYNFKKPTNRSHPIRMPWPETVTHHNVTHECHPSQCRTKKCLHSTTHIGMTQLHT